jgi:hypothetical protein
MIGIVTAVMPILLKLLGILLDKYVTNKEAKEAFIKMVASLETGGLSSVALHDSYRDQIEKHKAAAEKTETI